MMLDTIKEYWAAILAAIVGACIGGSLYLFGHSAWWILAFAIGVPVTMGLVICVALLFLTDWSH